MDFSTLESVGGVKVDRIPVRNNTSEISSEHLNRTRCDTAQMTNTSCKAWFSFQIAVGASPAAGDITLRSQWGNGDAQKPTIVHTGTGLFTGSFPATFTDATDKVETVSFSGAHGVAVVQEDFADPMWLDVYDVSGRTFKFKVTDSNPALADVGTVSADPVRVTIWLYG